VGFYNRWSDLRERFNIIEELFSISIAPVQTRGDSLVKYKGKTPVSPSKDRRYLPRNFKNRTNFVSKSLYDIFCQLKNS
jgi:hypothetical protein